MQALIDAEAAVEPRVVDQALPARRRARLLEVDAHDHTDVGRQLLADRVETPGVVEGRSGIVDRAGTDDDQEAVVGAAEDLRDLLAPGANAPRALLRQRKLLQKDRGWHQRADRRDVD